MFNFLFIMLTGAWAVLFLYRLCNLLLGTLKFIILSCEDQEKYSDYEEKMNLLTERMRQVTKVEEDFFNEVCPAENAKSKKVKKVCNGLMIALAIIAPIYAVISILCLIF